ncbi:MAG: hypothetical protein H6621_00950 [Halobacteriovoraceae bacterium]|nr:hypothetical protein [Halobacteriovoraceae bacterium]MCB9093609.1 hypothetical protein [Halobacteriovoraceae bacterium]
MAKFKRKIVINNRKFQFKYSLYFASVAISVSLLILSGVFYLLFDVYVEIMNYLSNANVNLAQLLNDRVIHAFYTLLGMIILFTLILFLTGLLLTHRIVGPIHKLKLMLQESSPEDFDRLANLKFRKGDEFQELAQVISDFFKKYKK